LIDRTYSSATFSTSVGGGHIGFPGYDIDESTVTVMISLSTTHLPVSLLRVHQDASPFKAVNHYVHTRPRRSTPPSGAA
jgi:hypothetical protein